MYDWMKKERNLFLTIGLVAGVVIPKVLKAKKTRELAVQGLAKGIMFKDTVMEEVANIKDEADDICAEAKVLAQANCEPTVCDDSVEE